MAKDADERYPSAGDLGRAAQAAAAGTVPTEPERVVARGAAAPGFAPTEPGIAAEARTRTAAPPPRAVARRRGADRLDRGRGWRARRGDLAVVLLDARRRPGAQAAPTPTPTPTATATATPVAKEASRRSRGSATGRAALVLTGGDLLVAGQHEWLTRIKADTGAEYAKHPKVGPDINAMVEFGGSVWMTLGFDRQVVRLDARTGKVRKRLKIAERPTRVAVDSQRAVGRDRAANGGRAGAALRPPRDADPGDHGPRGRRRPRRRRRRDLGGQGPHEQGRAADARRDEPRRLGVAAVPGRVRALRRRRPLGDARRRGRDRPRRRRDRQPADRRGRSQPGADACSRGATSSSPAATTTRSWSWTRDTLKAVGPPIEVGFNPYALAADERSVWVTGLGDNTLTRIDYR